MPADNLSITERNSRTAVLASLTPATSQSSRCAVDVEARPGIGRRAEVTAERTGLRQQSRHKAATSGARPAERSGGAAVEFERDERMIAGYPGVVSRLDHICITFGDVSFCPVFVNDVHAPSDDGP